MSVLLGTHSQGHTEVVLVAESFNDLSIVIYLRACAACLQNNNSSAVIMYETFHQRVLNGQQSDFCYSNILGWSLIYSKLRLYVYLF